MLSKLISIGFIILTTIIQIFVFIILIIAGFVSSAFLGLIPLFILVWLLKIFG